jgi:deoxyribonuclease V
MNIPPPIHRWDLTPKAAVRLQEKLAARVRVMRLRKKVRLVAGVDVAFSGDHARCIAGVAVYDPWHGEVVEQACAVRPVRFPYVPGLLTFREAPATLAAIRKLKSEPELFMFDGQGMAHPRRIGLASHVGLLIDRPSIGCAKSRLCGEDAEPSNQRGRFAPLVDRGQVVGAVLRTRVDVKPVFVSVGHRVTLNDAIHWVITCASRYRLPEPTRQAHLLVTERRKVV